MLQLRDNVPGILEPGKLVFWVTEKTARPAPQCVVREIYEEISYFVSPDRFQHLAIYGGSEFEADAGTVRFANFSLLAISLLTP